MRFLQQLITILILAFVFELFFPWWTIAIAAATGGYFLKSKANFLAGFLAIAMLWLVKVLLIDMASAVPLAEQVAKILLVNSKWLLLLVTIVTGGLVGGFASLSGSLLRSEKRRARYY